MTSIERITHIRHPGVIRDFRWPEGLLPLGRYNLIYGWNGSGKTTISELLRSVGAGKTPRFGEISLQLQGGQTARSHEPSAALAIRVFNRDYVGDNIFPVGGSTVPPILVLGEDSVEKQKQLEKLNEELLTLETERQNLSTLADSAEKAFDRFNIERARTIKETLRSSGANRFNTYDKGSFRDSIQRMRAASSAKSSTLPDAELELARQQHHSMPRPRLDAFSFNPPDLGATIERAKEVLGRSVASKTIEHLRANPDIAGWVHHGLSLHNPPADQSCQFCGQSLPADRLKDLGSHFSNEYAFLMQSIDSELDALQGIGAAYRKVVLPNRHEIQDDLSGRYQSAVERHLADLALADTHLSELVTALDQKRSQAFETVAFAASVALPSWDAAAEISVVIDQHNAACDEFTSRTSAARERLASHLVAEAFDEYTLLEGSFNSQTECRQALEVDITAQRRRASELERQIVEHRRPAEELNGDLRRYLGHGELTLTVEKTGYIVTRHGQAAYSLSEGEKTAIALLYFLKSLSDRRLDKQRCCVVLDDPVSSLDSNALFLAFGFIRSQTEAVGQIVVLTHNFSFFRQVRSWFHSLKGQKKPNPLDRPARFFMLQPFSDGDERRSRLATLDPLLESYESEYHYLFATLWRSSEDRAAGSLEQSYALPNMARRLLESFLAHRHPELHGRLEQQLRATEYDHAAVLRILRFLHTHSHLDSMPEPGHDLSALAEAQPVLHSLFDLIRTVDPRHYDGMVKSCELTPNSAAEAGS